jgi:hypothetical protein
MILYNVTISIDVAVKDTWIAWMRTTHIPEVLETKCFSECRFSRVHGEEDNGETYAVTYVCASMEVYDHYQQEFAFGLQSKTAALFSGKFAAFRTVLTVVEEFKA